MLPPSRPLLSLLLLLLPLLTIGLAFGRQNEKPPLSCASSSPPGNQECQGEGALCFDLLDLHSFICCCSHPFCNGKSPHLVKARWRMFLKGDYPAKVLRKSPRDVSKEMDAESRKGTVAKGEEANGTRTTTKGGTTTTTTMSQPMPTISSRKNGPTSSTQSPIHQKAEKKEKSPIQKKTTVKTAPTMTTKSTTRTTKNGTMAAVTKKPTTLASVKAKLTTVAFMSNKEKEEEGRKGIEILNMVGNESIEEETIATRKSIQKVDLANIGTTAIIVERTTMSPVQEKTEKTKAPEGKSQEQQPSPSSTPGTKASTNELPMTSTSTKASPPTTTTQSKSPSTIQREGPTSTQTPSTAKPRGTMDLISSASASNNSNSSRRTTRSPSSPAPITRPTQRPWLPAIPSFPWYFIALAGFLSSSAVFLLVYWTVKGCRRIFQKRMRTARGLGTAEGQSGGEAMMPMMNGEGRKAKADKKGQRLKKRSVPKANGQMSSKNTNESLMSQCTAITAIDEKKSQQKEEDMDYGRG